MCVCVPGGLWLSACFFGLSFRLCMLCVCVGMQVCVRECVSVRLCVWWSVYMCACVRGSLRDE